MSYLDICLIASMCSYNYMWILGSSVADHERFGADLDQDRTFHADADPDPNFFRWGEKKRETLSF